MEIVNIPTSINAHQLLTENIEEFQKICRKNPDLVPQFVQYADSQIAYMVGFWWLSLDDDRQKKAMLEKHSDFSSKYSFQTCQTYGTICRKIPTSMIMEVVKKIVISVSQVIVNATSSQQELEQLFNVALVTGMSAPNMATVIKEWKHSRSLGETIINRLPALLEGDRKDKSRLEELIKQVKIDFENQITDTTNAIKQEYEQKLDNVVKQDKSIIEGLNAQINTLKQKVTATPKSAKNDAGVKQMEAKIKELEQEVTTLKSAPPTPLQQVTVFDSTVKYPDDYEELRKYKEDNEEKERKLNAHFTNIAQSEISNMSKLAKNIINETDSVLNTGWVKTEKMLADINLIRNIIKQYL